MGMIQSLVNKGLGVAAGAANIVASGANAAEDIVSKNVKDKQIDRSIELVKKNASMSTLNRSWGQFESQRYFLAQKNAFYQQQGRSRVLTNFKLGLDALRTKLTERDK